MPLEIRSWEKWQGRVLKDVRRKREERGTRADLCYSMDYISVTAALDGDFSRFARAVGGQVAESYFLRTLQYVALHNPFHGCVDVARNTFGPVVLTRAWDVVSARRGGRAWDAFIDSGLAAICPGHVRDTSPPRPAELVRDERVGENNPPNPPAGGGGSASPQEQQDDQRLVATWASSWAKISDGPLASKAREFQKRIGWDGKRDWSSQLAWIEEHDPAGLQKALRAMRRMA